MIGSKVVAHPSVVLGDVDAVAADQVDRLLVVTDVFDGCAGVVATALPGELD